MPPTESVPWTSEQATEPGPSSTRGPAAGIAAGVVVAILLLAAALMLVYRYRHGQQGSKTFLGARFHVARRPRRQSKVEKMPGSELTFVSQTPLEASDAPQPSTSSIQHVAQWSLESVDEPTTGFTGSAFLPADFEEPEPVPNAGKETSITAYDDGVLTFTPGRSTSGSHTLHFVK